MTDTSRTVEELKALLAENTSGNISSQTMRDVVESIANPVPGGGFESVTYSAAKSVGAYNSSPQTVVSGMDTTLDALTSYHDPSGMLQSGSYTSSMIENVTVGPQQWLRLPEAGIWMIYPQVFWGDLALGSFRGLMVVPIDDRGAQLDVDPFLYRPGYTEGMSTSPHGYFAPKGALTGFHAAPTILPVTQAMLDASDGQSPSGSGWAVMPGRVHHDAGAPIVISSTNAYAMRIG